MPSSRPAMLVWCLLACVVGSLLLRALLAAPPGTVFAGTFYFADDFYNYLASVEQAQRGELLFRSKLAPPSSPAALVNLEWTFVGWLAALLGGRPLVAYWAVALASLGLLVAITGRWLIRAGLPNERLLPALLLVFVGGGPGGLLYLAGLLPGERALDLRTGAFPFLEAVGNPHFVVGTTMLLAALSAFAAGRPWLGASLGVALSLIRPYDAALLLAVETAALAMLRPRDWRHQIAPLALTAASLAYPAWLFTSASGFQVFSSAVYAQVTPRPTDVLLAFSPALVLVALTGPTTARSASQVGRSHLWRLALWAACALGIAMLRPVSFALQFLVGAGLPLLALASLGLARHGRALWLCLPLLGTSSAVVAWLCTLPTPSSHPPAERWLVTEVLRTACAPGDVLLAPADIGLYAGAFSPCWPLVSHAAGPDHARLAPLVAAFYRSETPPARRADILDRACIAHLILPPRLPEGWLGEPSAYVAEQAVVVDGRALAVWSRSDRACSPDRSRGR